MRAATLAIALWACAFGAAADDTQPTAQELAWSAAMEAMQEGPIAIPLRDQAILDLPSGYAYVPQGPSAKLLTEWGNTVGNAFIGMILPLSEESWFVTLEYEPSGFIADDDARDWDADAMLDQLKEGTEAGNTRRAQIGMPALKVTRWIEPPAYESIERRLVWSAETQLKDIADDDPGVNYNTFVLGREGYVSLNLVTSAVAVDAYKSAARELLATVRFNDGKRYEDFDSSTDTVAAYGLAALVGGVAAKKLGLLALAGAFFAKFAKVILLALAGAGAAVAKFRKRDKRQV